MHTTKEWMLKHNKEWILMRFLSSIVVICILVLAVCELLQYSSCMYLASLVMVADIVLILSLVFGPDIVSFFREGIHCRVKHGTVAEADEKFHYETDDREPRFTLTVESDNGITIQGKGFGFYRDRDTEQKFHQGDRVIVKYDTRTNEVKQVGLAS